MVSTFETSSLPLVSIVINNYNYAQFLELAIKSALRQDYKNCEVIVVDDGSTDNSIEVAEQFGSQIKIISKRNGGQASAINRGIAESSGEWILFLDSDDELFTYAVSELASQIGPEVCKIHCPLRIVYQTRGLRRYGGLIPSSELSTGNVLPLIEHDGNYVWPPTSGNMFCRKALNHILPVDEANYRLCADLFLCLKIAEQGIISKIDKPLGLYRVHGHNNYSGMMLTQIQLARKSDAYYLHSKLVSDMAGVEAAAKVWTAREALEGGLLARRFVKLDHWEDRVPEYSILKFNYDTHYHGKELGGWHRAASILNWIILRYAPRSVVWLWMAARIQKARRFSIRLADEDVLSSV
jgi:glycosyltransferase involved in cell wall biosynthesis